MRWIVLPTIKTYVEVLAPSPSECDLFEDRGFTEVIKLKLSH